MSPVSTAPASILPPWMLAKTHSLYLYCVLKTSLPLMHLTQNQCLLKTRWIPIVINMNWKKIIYQFTIIEIAYFITLIFGGKLSGKLFILSSAIIAVSLLIIHFLILVFKRARSKTNMKNKHWRERHFTLTKQEKAKVIFSCFCVYFASL